MTVLHTVEVIEETRSHNFVKEFSFQLQPNMQNLLTISLIICLITFQVDGASQEQAQDCPNIDVDYFRGLLYTEVHDEVDALHNERRTSNRNMLVVNNETSKDAQDLWTDIIAHGWSAIDESQILDTRARSMLHADNLKTDASSRKGRHEQAFPLLICNQNLSSGAERKRAIEKDLENIHRGMIVVYNDKNQTCFHAGANSAEAIKLKKIATQADSGYMLVPMTDIMKITANTFTEVNEYYWVPKSSEVQKDDRWERMIRVTFTTGDQESATEDNAEARAKDIILYTISIGESGAENRRLADESIDNIDNHMPTSISAAFSLTSRKKWSRRLQKEAKGRSEFLSRSLGLGLEASHGCKRMFKDMNIVVQSDGRGFDIVLNPIGDESEFKGNHENPKGGIDSSASNVNCVTSLIIALSTHPSVLNVEVDTPVTPDDFEASWIIESKESSHTPFSDIGLTGNGQIVSIWDSGVQLDHRFIGPTHAKVMNRWDTKQRKIVRYDTTYGDGGDASGGHGTSVATIIAGRALSGDSDANGIAEDAKLHVNDLSVSGSSLTIPGDPRNLFKSMYNNGNGAKIANGSFSTRYSVYKTSCRIYDNYLYGDYQDILYVASAGNEGSSGGTSRMNTIGNPAACKNTLAVGASQSSGSKLNKGDMGSDYMAMFSSRGPTADNRMKPDIVAPGSTVLTGNAYSAENGQDTKAVVGTSFAAPIVAGSAAIIRQYFEEGWFPCGTIGCGLSIQPSGSLLKAVLMNGGQNLERVQKVLGNVNDKVIGEDLKPYDNSQGMGLVNLAASLPLNDGTNFNALARNNNIIKDGEEHTFVVKAKTRSCPNPTLSVTVAWYDQGAANGCVKCLLNDLDVTVQRTTWNGRRKGRLFRGNNNVNGDDRNNVERVRVMIRNRRRYIISIKAANLSEQSIKYSMIATGCFKIKKVDA
jgi:hypothetical protein